MNIKDNNRDFIPRIKSRITTTKPNLIGIFIDEEYYVKLQIAIDMVDTSTAVKMVNEIYDVIDIVEIGTPMIMLEGIKPVEILKKKYPSLTVLADTKIIDGGGIEAGYAFKAGADIVTVLAIAPDDTVKAVVESAKKHGGETLADLICSQDIINRSKELIELGVDYICLHTAHDEQNTKKAPLDDLISVKENIKDIKTAIAGGVNFHNIGAIAKIQPEIIIAGSALTKADNLRIAVTEMVSIIRGS